MSYKSVGAIILALAALVLVIGAVFVGGCITINTHPTAPVAAVTPEPTPVPAPTPAPSPVVVPVVVTQQTITFTVLSTTTATGHYQVLTTTDEILFCNDYATWNFIVPQNTYTATVTPNGDGTFTINSVVLVYNAYAINYAPVVYDYPVYYHYGTDYYQYDGRVVDRVSYKEVVGHRVIEGAPPHPYVRGVTITAHH